MLRSAPIAVHRFVGAAAILLAIGSSACTDRACFKVSRATMQCPSATDAKPRFGGCSNIESIDSDGSLVAGNLCCYDVTHSLDGIPGPGPCMGFGGGSSTRGSSGDVAPGMAVATSAETSTATGEHTTSTGSGLGGNGAGGAGGNGGAPSCESLSCGFKADQPLSGCLSCAESTLCAAQSSACLNDMECQQFEICIGGCDLPDPACISACRAMFPDGASVFGSFLQCAVCDTCPTACASSPAVALAQCAGSGGSGGAGGVGGSGGVGGTSP